MISNKREGTKGCFSACLRLWHLRRRSKLEWLALKWDFCLPHEERKKVTHYNYSTWFTELSHLCSPTFPLISFGDLGKVYVCVCVRVCECDCLIYTQRIFFFLASFSPFICVWAKIKIPMLLFRDILYFSNNKCIDPWNLPLFSLHCESEITLITKMHATLSMTAAMWCSLMLNVKVVFWFFVTK